MKLPSLLVAMFAAVTISSAHAVPEARGDRSTFAPGSEIAFDIESNQATRAVPPDQGGLHDNAIDDHSIVNTVRTATDRAPEPDFLPLVP